jgi:hypothetical protein
MRWAAVAWLAVWIPTYLQVWGWYNFLFFCDVAVLLTCLGLWRGNALLLSSQAVGAIVINLLWTLDAAWRLLLGRHLIGGTEYMWDANYPLWIRFLSLFHVVWPLLLLWAVRRTGYDPRGIVLQSGIAVVVMVLSRIVEEMFAIGKNLNFVMTDPIFHRSWGQAPVHLTFHLIVLIAVIYWPTHLVLRRFLPPLAPKP